VRNKNGNSYFSDCQYLRPENTDRPKKTNLLESLLNSIGNQNDDNLQHYEIILGDFNCVLDKKLDRCLPHRTEDNGLNEFKLLMHHHDLFDIWRNDNPKTKRFRFHRGNAKSRIDYIICSNSLISKLLDSKINEDAWVMNYKINEVSWVKNYKINEISSLMNYKINEVSWIKNYKINEVSWVSFMGKELQN
jgi:hypothetical protein